MKTISIFGSTGSIGTQSLAVVDVWKNKFYINTLTTNTNIELLEKQCEKYSPKTVVIVNEKSFHKFKETTNFKGNILCGEDSLIEMATDTSNDLLIMSLVGFAGVLPTYKAIQAGVKNIALANKEVLVVAGHIVMLEAQKHNTKILPIDSEHSAIFQCLIGENEKSVDKIILTASGGPFYKFDKDSLKNVTVADALKHPAWNMGKKVTIDSATLMNKGFEVIEAYYLFLFKNDKKNIENIDVIIHPQAIIHSMVRFNDNSIKAQLSCPDMRLPITFAMNFPHRLKFQNYSQSAEWWNKNPFDFENNKEINLTFLPVDIGKFKCLEIVYLAHRIGGNSLAIVNAANEIIIDAFIENKISFAEIPKYIELSLEKIQIIKFPSLDDLIETNLETRNFISKQIQSKC